MKRSRIKNFSCKIYKSGNKYILEITEHWKGWTSDYYKDSFKSRGKAEKYWTLFKFRKRGKDEKV